MLGRGWAPAVAAAAAGIVVGVGIGLLWRSRRRAEAVSAPTGVTAGLSGDPMLVPVVDAEPAALRQLVAGGDHPLTAVDEQLIQHCYAVRNGMRKPMHSQFRVVAVLSVTLRQKESDGSVCVRHVVGTNHEIGIIGGSICAERTALGKLQLVDFDRVVAVHLVTDSPLPITPGTLCREYLSEVAITNMRVVSHASGGSIITTLRDLYPHSYLYAGLDRDSVVAFAREVARTAQPPAQSPSLRSPEVKLVAQAVAAAGRDNRDALHPVRMGGAVLFQDGTTSVTWQSKALEYGATAGVFTKLLAAMQAKADAGVAVQLAVQADQFGVLHAPCGQDRALLSEHGLLSCRIAVHAAAHAPHSKHGYDIQVVTVGDLVPMTPAMEESLE